MANIDRLRQELNGDPLSRGYAGMTIQQAADSLNARNREIVGSTLQGGVLFNAIVPSEFTALSQGNQDIIRWITQVGGGTIDVSEGTNARALIIDIFGGASQTIANIAAELTTTVSRAEELNLLGASREIGPAHVEQART